MKQQPLKIALCKKLESDLSPRWWFTHCWQPESETHIYQCTVLNTAKQEALVVKVATWWHTFDLFTYYFQLYLTLVVFFFFSPLENRRRRSSRVRESVHLKCRARGGTRAAKPDPPSISGSSRNQSLLPRNQERVSNLTWRNWWRWTTNKQTNKHCMYSEFLLRYATTTIPGWCLS